MWPAPRPPGTPKLQPVLGFEQVTRRHPDGSRQITVLDRVSFSVREGAFMGLFGLRRAGKSTLLRLAAGIELPDEGRVRFEGRSLTDMPLIERERLLRGPIALISPAEWRPVPGERVVDYVALALASRGLGVPEGRRRARQALVRVALAARTDELAASLSAGERMRAMLARAIVREPRLVLVDEPALVPGLAERDEIGMLIRLVAHELGAALIVASEELSALHGAGVLISISSGELCSTEDSRSGPAEQEHSGVVIELPARRRSARERPSR